MLSTTLDPANRLVADSLEADWNTKLRALAEARDRYEQQTCADGATGPHIDRARVLALVQDFPAIWHDPQIPPRERKRMVGLLIEDVTVLKADTITAHVRFRGGATTTLTLPLPLNAWQGRKTPPAVVAEIDALLADHTAGDVARILNEHRRATGAGLAFSAERVRWVRFSAGLPSLKQRLKERGWLTPKELAAHLGVHDWTVRTWRKGGRLRGRICNDRGEWLFDPSQNPLPAGASPKKASLPKSETDHHNVESVA